MSNNKWYCDQCGSNNVHCEDTVIWSYDRQSWESTGDRVDNDYCDDCEAETSLSMRRDNEFFIVLMGGKPFAALNPNTGKHALFECNLEEYRAWYYSKFEVLAPEYAELSLLKHNLNNTLWIEADETAREDADDDDWGVADSDLTKHREHGEGFFANGLKPIGIVIDDVVVSTVSALGFRDAQGNFHEI